MCPHSRTCSVFRPDIFTALHADSRARLAAKRGFSTVELMVTLTIAAIFLTLAIPGFSSLLERQKLTTATNDLFAAINLTRSEAIQRGTRVDLVPADASNWNNGWLVLVDDNGNQKADPGEKVVFSHGAVPAGISVTSTFTTSNPPYVAYNGTGRTRTNGDDQQSLAGNFRFESANLSRKIVINFLGRPRTCDPASKTATC